MRRARAGGARASAGELPIGSVVAVDGEIVARAHWRSSDGLLAHPSWWLAGGEAAGSRWHDARAVPLVHGGRDVRFANGSCSRSSRRRTAALASERFGIRPAARSRRTAAHKSNVVCTARNPRTSCASSWNASGVAVRALGCDARLGRAVAGRYRRRAERARRARPCQERRSRRRCAAGPRRRSTRPHRARRLPGRRSRRGARGRRAT